MNLDPIDIRLRYEKHMRALLEDWILKGRDALEIEAVVDKVCDELGRVQGFRGEYGQRSVWSLVRTMTIRRGIDRARLKRCRKPRQESVGALEERGQEPGQADRAVMAAAGESGPSLADLVEDYAIPLRNPGLLEAYCQGLSRREMAAKFGLTENQVKGRLEYMRRKIRAVIERKRRLGKLSGY